MIHSSRFQILLPPFVIFCILFLVIFQIQKENCRIVQVVIEKEEALSSSELHPLVNIRKLPSNVKDEELVKSSLIKLSTDYAPNNVLYVWCGKRWFEFGNYLSVISSIRYLDPDNVFFYYDHYPILDEWKYNDWIDYLKDEFPFFKLVKEKSACIGHQKINLPWLKSKLSEHGGLYVSEFSIIIHFPLSLRKNQFINGYDENTGKGFILAKDNLPGKRSFGDLILDKNLKTKAASCLSERNLNRLEKNRKSICVNIQNSFFPKNIWETETRFASEMRYILYGERKPQIPIQNENELIPNIAHIVWLGGGEMDFLFYLGVLSLIYVAKVDMVYIHGDLPPSGNYWYKVMNNPKLRLVYRENPNSVYGKNVKIISHTTDIWRVDFMLKYGGIYVDTDTAFVRPLSKELRSYDAIGTYDWTYWNHPWPDTINFGVTAGKRGAKYWRLFQKTMKNFIDKDWSYNGLRQPYRVKELHPTLLKIEPKLQITCFEFKCHPTYWENYHNESIHHLNSNSIKNWKTDAFAFHWTLPTPPELKNEENLKKSNTIFAEIAKYILNEAGVELN